MSFCYGKSVIIAGLDRDLVQPVLQSLQVNPDLLDPGFFSLLLIFFLSGFLFILFP